jgi:hypothetical protein
MKMKKIRRIHKKRGSRDQKTLRNRINKADRSCIVERCDIYQEEREKINIDVKKNVERGDGKASGVQVSIVIKSNAAFRRIFIECMPCNQFTDNDFLED